MSSNNVSSAKHFVFFTTPAFGHIRPTIGLIAKLLSADADLACTVFVIKFLVPIIDREIQQAIPGVLGRIRLIGVGNSDEPPRNYFKSIGDMTHDIPPIYQALVRQDTSVQCTSTQRTFDYSDPAWPPPSVALFDMFSTAAPVIKETTPSVRIVTAYVGTANQFVAIYGPPENGGGGEIEAQINAEMTKGDGDRSFDEVAMGILTHRPGNLQVNAEEVELYDYEMVPQANSPPARPIGPTISSVKLVNQFSEATIVMSTREFEPKSTKAATAFYSSLNKQLFFVGPQVPTTYKVPPFVHAPTYPFSPIFTFLDAQQPKSTIIISFGTVWYPSNPKWLVETVLKTLLETRTPFVFSRAAAMYQPIDPELEKALTESKVGLIVERIPQREMLGHPSIGAFVTHGGANSVFESVFAGVPCIFWPFTADQPVHAAYMSRNLDCAWELIQVRSGPNGLRPPARGGKVEGTPDALAAEVKQVLSELKEGNSVGERKKVNLMALREQTLNAMSDGGEAEVALKEFMAFVEKPKVASS